MGEIPCPESHRLRLGSKGCGPMTDALRHREVNTSGNAGVHLFGLIPKGWQKVAASAVRSQEDSAKCKVQMSKWLAFFISHFALCTSHWRFRFATPMSRLILIAVLLFALPGCSRMFWRTQADFDTYNQLLEKTQDP